MLVILQSTIATVSFSFRDANGAGIATDSSGAIGREAAGAAPVDAWNECCPDVIRASEAHCFYATWIGRIAWGGWIWMDVVLL